MQAKGSSGVSVWAHEIALTLASIRKGDKIKGVDWICLVGMPFAQKLAEAAYAGDVDDAFTLWRLLHGDKMLTVEMFGPTYTVIYKHHRETGHKLARQILTVALALLVEVAKEDKR